MLREAIEYAIWMLVVILIITATYLPFIAASKQESVSEAECQRMSLSTRLRCSCLP